MKKLVLFFAFFAFCACAGRFDEEAINETTTQFFTSLQSENWTLTNRIYPNFSKIASFHNFINYTVESMNYEKGKGICVNVDLEYLTSQTAPASHYKVKFYFEKDKETKTYFIKDSEYFAVFDRETYNYKYAILTGCLDEFNDVTDVVISEKLTASQKMYDYYYNKINEDVLAGITMTKRLSSMFGSGDFYRVFWKIENKSQYDLDGLKLRYTSPTFSDWKTGTMKIKTIKSGEHLEIESDGGEIGGKSQTGKLLIDDAIHNIIQIQTSYTGGEYEKYLQEVQESEE